MNEKVKPNPQEATTQDAELVAESIQEKPKAAPDIDFENDYRLAQEMSKSSADSEEDTTDASSSNTGSRK